MRPALRRTNARRTRVRWGTICAQLDALAPFAYAADWDNVGLLAGRPEWPVRRTLLAVDLTDDVAREALRKRADLLVLYHPPIFKGIRSVTPTAECPTTLLPDLLAARVSMIALHTAFDAAVGGPNDILLDAIEPVRRYPLEPVTEYGNEYKLVVFVPSTELQKLRRALSACGAGVIGHYHECSFEQLGRGTFRGDETTLPTVGRKCVLEHVDEVRLEMIVPHRRLGEVVRALYATHSYEEPAFDVYPLHQLPAQGRIGDGRVGELNRPQRGDVLIEKLGQRVDLAGAAVVGNLTRRFRSVTAAAGAFGVRRFRDPDSLVITGEFKHHDALELMRRGITAVCLGHYVSERPALDVVRAHLLKTCPGIRYEIARADRCPFVCWRAVQRMRKLRGALRSGGR